METTQTPAVTPVTSNNSAHFSAPMAVSGANGLVLNCIVPGLGLLVYKPRIIGAVQLLLWLASIAITVYAFFGHYYLLAFSVPGIVIAYLWSVISGMFMLKRTQPPVV